MQIGDKIKKLRKAVHMTLTTLSKESGVQIATLSRIENGKMTGTLESHIKIAQVLGVDITDFYKDTIREESRVDLKAEKNKTNIFIHSEKCGYEILTTQVFSKKMMPMHYRIQPQGSSNNEQNKSGTDKFIFVLEGKLQILIGDSTFTLSKGHSMYFDASLPHQFKNEGSREVRFLCVATPVVL